MPVGCAHSAPTLGPGPGMEHLSDIPDIPWLIRGSTILTAVHHSLPPWALGRALSTFYNIKHTVRAAWPVWQHRLEGRKADLLAASERPGEGASGRRGQRVQLCASASQAWGYPESLSTWETPCVRDSLLRSGRSGGGRIPSRAYARARDRLRAGCPELSLMSERPARRPRTVFNVPKGTRRGSLGRSPLWAFREAQSSPSGHPKEAPESLMT